MNAFVFKLQVVHVFFLNRMNTKILDAIKLHAVEEKGHQDKH